MRLNREAGADFDLDAFAHRADWNDDASRIEMHLVSLRDQVVRVAGEAIHFARGETIHTENSYKYAPERFAELAEQAGWRSAELWTDPARLFSLHLLEPRQGRKRATGGQFPLQWYLSFRAKAGISSLGPLSQGLTVEAQNYARLDYYAASAIRSPERKARNCKRARCTRLFNVPIAQPVTSEASSYDCSSSTIICNASR